MRDNKSKYHHGDLRAALIGEAVDMIADGGVESLTMRDISGRLGVSRAAPYRHFPKKSDLLVAVAASGFEGLRDRMQAMDAAAPRSSVERVRRLGEEYVRFAIENPAQYRLMYGKEALSRQDLPVLREAANAIFDHLVLVIRAHQKSGGIKRQDPRMMAFVAWSSVHGLASLIIEGQILTEIDVDELIRQTTRTLLDGMRVHRTCSTRKS
ncbi:TetR/AcrR family transcriptional regulator [bacterium]|nr:TetR/AcrR family transcriptional regulator [bacterium]